MVLGDKKGFCLMGECPHYILKDEVWKTIIPIIMDSSGSINNGWKYNEKQDIYNPKASPGKCIWTLTSHGET